MTGLKPYHCSTKQRFYQLPNNNNSTYSKEAILRRVSLVPDKSMVVGHQGGIYLNYQTTRNIGDDASTCSLQRLNHPLITRLLLLLYTQKYQKNPKPFLDLKNFYLASSTKTTSAFASIFQLKKFPPENVCLNLFIF